MTRAEEGDLLESFMVCRSHLRVSCLQFLKNSIFFLRARVEDVLNAKLTLLVFGWVFRLKDNLNKGTLLLINVNHNLLNRLAAMLGCSFYDGLIFGLSLGRNLKAPHLFLERIFIILDG